MTTNITTLYHFRFERRGDGRVESLEMARFLDFDPVLPGWPPEDCAPQINTLDPPGFPRARTARGSGIKARR